MTSRDEDRSRDEFDTMVQAARIARERAQMPEAVEAAVRQRLAPTVERLAERRGRGSRWHWGLLRPSTLAWGAAAAVLVAILVPVVRSDLWQRPTVQADVSGVIGELAIVTPDQTRRGEVAALPGDTVRTGKAGRVRFTVGSDRWVVLDNTTLTWERQSGQDLLRLTSGLIVASIRPTPGHSSPRMRILTPHGTVVVTGTVLLVQVDDQDLHVAVPRGAVSVEAQPAIRVAQGQAVTITGGHARSQALSRERQQAILAAVTAPLEGIDLVETHAPTLAGDEAPRRDVSRAAIPRRAARRASDAALASIPPDIRDLTMAGKCIQAEQALPRMAQGTPATVRAQALVTVADCHLAALRADDALRLYRVAVQRFGATPPGQNAAYELGAVALALDRADEAKTAFRAYARRYPRGTLVAEARFHVCSLDVAAQRTDEALACLRDYRALHPKGDRLADALFLEATVLVTNRNDCDAAAPLYERYVGLGGERIAQAQKWLDHCRRANETR